MKSFKKSFSLNFTTSKSAEQQHLVIQQQAKVIETQQFHIYKLETHLETLSEKNELPSKFPAASDLCVSNSPKCSSSRISNAISKLK